MPPILNSAMLSRMAGRPRTRPPKKHETTLQSLFVRRVLEEMEDQKIFSAAELAGREGAPSKRTLTAVLNDGHVPGLTVVAGIAAALRMQPWELLADRAKADSRESTTNVRKLPERYGKIFAPHQTDRAITKKPKRNTSRV